MLEICRRLKILVAEDTPLYRKLLGHLLDERGYAVQTVATGREAIEAYLRDDLDLILMDVHLPDLDGIQATAEIRRLEEGQGRRLPILGLTEAPVPMERTRCLAAGMDGYVVKPTYPTDLFMAVDQALGVESPASPTLDRSTPLPTHHDVDDFLNAVMETAESIRQALERRDGVETFVRTSKMQDLLEALPGHATSQTAAELALMGREGRWTEATSIFRSLLAEISRMGPALARLSGEERVRILVADDDEMTRTQLSDMLTEWGYQVIAVPNGRQAMELLQHPDPPRLAILDKMMPGMGGLDICREVRRRQPEPYIYLLLCTSSGEKQDVVEGLDAGADDYLIKPVDNHELKVRLQAGRRVLEVQRELICAREILRLQATRDSLTSLLNRGALMDLLHSELARQKRQRMPLSLLLLDIDHFKDVNDTYGHQAGDTVLRKAARRIRACLRTYDGVGRYGGEEFLIVLPGAPLEGAARLADRLRSQIAQEVMFEVNGHPVHITISIGAAATVEGEDTTASALIQAADVALYRAKRSGRNKVEVAITSDYMELVRT